MTYFKSATIESRTPFSGFSCKVANSLLSTAALPLADKGSDYLTMELDT